VNAHQWTLLSCRFAAAAWNERSSAILGDIGDGYEPPRVTTAGLVHEKPNPQPYEVWWVKNFVFKPSDRPKTRPVLVMHVNGDNAIVHPMSHDLDYFKHMRPNGSSDFNLGRDSKDYGATGLYEDSFIFGETYVVPLSSFRNKSGTLTGDLLKEFTNEHGYDMPKQPQQPRPVNKPATPPSPGPRPQPQKPQPQPQLKMNPESVKV